MSGSGLTLLDKESDVLFVRSSCTSGLVGEGTLQREPGFLGTLIRMRVVVAVLGEVGDVGGEGSAEGWPGGEGRDIMRVVIKGARSG